MATRKQTKPTNSTGGRGKEKFLLFCPRSCMTILSAMLHKWIRRYLCLLSEQVLSAYLCAEHRSRREGQKERVLRQNLYRLVGRCRRLRRQTPVPLHRRCGDSGGLEQLLPSSHQSAAQQQDFEQIPQGLSSEPETKGYFQVPLRHNPQSKGIVYNKRQTLRLRKVNCDLHLAGNVAVNQRHILSCFRNLINANISLIYANIKEYS